MSNIYQGKSSFIRRKVKEKGEKHFHEDISKEFSSESGSFVWAINNIPSSLRQTWLHLITCFELKWTPAWLKLPPPQQHNTRHIHLHKLHEPVDLQFDAKLTVKYLKVQSVLACKLDFEKSLPIRRSARELASLKLLPKWRSVSLFKHNICVGAGWSKPLITSSKALWLQLTLELAQKRSFRSWRVYDFHSYPSHPLISVINLFIYVSLSRSF